MKTSNNILRPARLQFLSMQRVWARLFLGILTAMSLGYGVADAQSNLVGQPQSYYQSGTRPSGCNAVPNIYRQCGKSANGKLCGVCPPNYTCNRSGQCIQAPAENCSWTDWNRACRDWHQVVVANSVCAAAVLACAGFTGGPAAGPACVQIAAYTGCGWGLIMLTYAIDANSQCVNYQVQCESRSSGTRPGMCDPRGTSGMQYPVPYCDSCCLMALPYDTASGGRPGSNDLRRPGCKELCMQLAQQPKEPESPPAQNPNPTGPGTCSPGDPLMGAGNFCMPPYRPSVNLQRNTCTCVR